MESKTCAQSGCTKKVKKSSSVNCHVCTMILKAQQKRTQANQKLLNHIASTQIFSGSMKLFS